MGFWNKALVWNRKVNEVIQVVHFQIDQHSSNSSTRFTINLGICCPKVRYITWGDQEPSSHDETDCCPRFRVGYLLADEKLKHLDKWWVIEDGDGSAVGEALSTLTGRCIPYLNQYSTLSEMYQVARNLKPKMHVADKIYLAVMAHLLDQISERDATFSELLSSGTVSWHARIDQVLKRLGLSIASYS